jgi:hypothetical protein
MSSVSKKTGVSKEVVRGRRTLTKEKPVSEEEIRRDAEKIGAIQRPGEPAPGSLEDFELWKVKQKAIEGLPVTLTLREACDLVGRDLEPAAFQEQVFNVLARELDVLSDLAEDQAHAGFDGWCAFQNLRSRIELAGKIAAVIGGAS